MKKIHCTGVLLLVLTLAVTSAAMAGNMNKSGGGAVLTPEETAGVLFVREEEKLARDVYLMLWAKWDLGVFENIAASEQQHMDAVLALLEKYGLEDPVLDPGVFQNPELQALYDELMEKGEASIVDAVEVGVIIEKTDIEDLTLLLDGTDKNDIVTVYTNLREGSYNHLEAFEGHLQE